MEYRARIYIIASSDVAAFYQQKKVTGMPVEMAELIAITLPLYIMVAGLYFRMGKNQQKLDMINKNIEYTLKFKNNK